MFVCRGCGAQHGTQAGECLSCGFLTLDRFDSLGEANHWARLLLLERAGKIGRLRRQVRFPLYASVQDGATLSRERVGFYVADFVYERDSETIIADFKGSAITELAAWKLRHMAAQGQPVYIVGN